jgi:ABC-type amino acid transport substrate-binding protein
MQNTQRSSKRSFTVALIASATLFLSAQAQAQTALDDLMKNKLIKVAVQTDSAPYGYVGTDLKPIGLDIDLANYIGKNLAWRWSLCRSIARIVFQRYKRKKPIL